MHYRWLSNIIEGMLSAASAGGDGRRGKDLARRLLCALLALGMLLNSPALALAEMMEIGRAHV